MSAVRLPPRVGWLAAALAAGCGGDGAADLRVCAEPDAPSEVWVLSQLRFARVQDGAVAGFDLDGVTSAAGDGTACGHADRVDPDGQPGVDNAFAGLVPILEGTEAVAAESLIAQSIASGELLMTFDIADAQTWSGDDCVDFTLGRAEGAPLVGPDGRLLAPQTLRPSASIAPVHTVATTDARVLLAEDLRFNLPLDVLNASLDFRVGRGQIRLQRRHDGAVWGAMGGVIPIEQVIEILERPDVQLGHLAPLALAAADVRDEDGACSLLSFGFEIEALPAFLEAPLD